MDESSPFDYRGIDDVIHSRIRLAIMAILAAVDDAEFTYLKDQVQTTDGNLSTHLTRLSEAGYVATERLMVDARPVSRYRLTKTGRQAFRSYLKRLEDLLGGLQP